MGQMRLVKTVEDEFRLMGSQEERPDVEEGEEGDGTNMEEDIPHTSPSLDTLSGASTTGAGSSFQQAFDLSNEEVLARMISRMDMFDARIQGIETMILIVFIPWSLCIGVSSHVWTPCKINIWV
ncbi:hypothetical protein JCGZ_22103 [Jatropha curcas]|uniref:Uncharacterized protein n=1 Tax=Jatropha curcas TaxID=180498 RepID=A0A067JU61_JATCU|nr:hypothetical protein JCGZ_22103 [Jatropha curcas]